MCVIIAAHSVLFNYAISKRNITFDVENANKNTKFSPINKIMKFLPSILIVLLMGCSNHPSVEIRIPVIDSMTIVISGDFMQHYPQVVAARVDSGYSYDESLSYIAPLWRSADYSIINLETTLSADGPYSGYPAFRSPDEIAHSLKHAGITHLALANNHTLDAGFRGVRSTIDAARRAEIEYFGAEIDSAKTYTILESDSLRIGIFNATYGTNGISIPAGVHLIERLDTVRLASAISELTALNTTHIIAFLHWGNEYQIAPSSEQKKLAMWLRAKGVNLVVGSHPHVPQPIDYRNSVVYSLGNFVSNQRFRNTDAGYSIRITFFQGVDRPVIKPYSHYVDISKSGVQKYRVLTLGDTSVVENPQTKERMISRINSTNKIINNFVQYD